MYRKAEINENTKKCYLSLCGFGKSGTDFEFDSDSETLRVTKYSSYERSSSYDDDGFLLESISEVYRSIHTFGIAQDENGQRVLFQKRSESQGLNKYYSDGGGDTGRMDSREGPTTLYRIGEDFSLLNFTDPSQIELIDAKRPSSRKSKC